MRDAVVTVPICPLFWNPGRKRTCRRSALRHGRHRARRGKGVAPVPDPLPLRRIRPPGCSRRG
jgi:hypothetical protein